MSTSALPAPTGALGPITLQGMLANIPADIAAEFATPPTLDAPSDTSADDVIDDSTADAAPAEDAPAIDEPPTDEPAAEPEETPEPASPADAKPATEDLEDGITKGKNKSGKPGYFLEDGRYKTVYQNHKTMQQAAERIGEPLTIEKIEQLNLAHLGQERLFNNLASADPVAQRDVVGFLLSEMQGAVEAGEVGTDPRVPFAETVYTTLRDGWTDNEGVHHEPPAEAYNHLRFLQSKDLLEEMFDLAGRTGDTALLNAAGHTARALAGVGPKPPEMSEAQYLEYVRQATGYYGLPFRTREDVEKTVRAGAAEEPLTAARQRIQELEAQVNGRSATSATEQFKAWDRAQRQSVNKAVADAVKPALASAEVAWKDYPEAYNDLVVKRLNGRVNDELMGDQGLNQRAVELNAQARRATSEQVRQRLGQQIRELYVNRANFLVAKHAPEVLDFAAKTLQGRSEATHERRAGAQNRTVPKGPSAPVQRSVMPDMPAFKNGAYDSSIAYKQAQRMMAALQR